MDPNSSIETNLVPPVETATPTVEQNPIVQPVEPIIPPPVIPDLPKPKNKLLPILMIVLFIILMGVGGMFIYKNYFFKPTTQPINNSTNQPTSTPDPTTDWQTYTNDKLGFSFKYPNTSMINNNNYTGYSSTYTISKISVNDPVTEITLFIGTNDESKTQTNGKQTKVAGLDATRFSLPVGQNPAQELVFFKNNENYYSFQFVWDGKTQKDLETFNQILSSFKFIENNQSTISNKKIGYIRSIAPSIDNYKIKIDYIDFVQDKNSPNGFRIENSSVDLVDLQTDITERLPVVTMQTYSHGSDGNYNFNQVVSFNEFLSAFNSNASIKAAPYWIEMTNGIVTKISEQYIP